MAASDANFDSPCLQKENKAVVNVFAEKKKKTLHKDCSVPSPGAAERSLSVQLRAVLHPDATNQKLVSTEKLGLYFGPS